ncbi:putative LRR receptor-like serine/threonine-protein kinase [Camellia lanceoleosa]|uniref:LRR receptor-like serine/threonine-protein kinase n=1 Tax=Camellia lanceoleosa TaxID=1840588 RepID=A0ACC0I3B4_9ERIC|nr:putative LRR receptor-like serine/threonine-protein kinase [Camellia lanceoleosa]
MLLDGTDVAAKILNLQVDGAFRSFDAKCQVLRTVRHRNLVKVISSCSNPEVRALVLKYMPNGSLEYDLEGRVSMKCDIYSYGIMLLEIFTRKRPTDEMFAGELSLRQLVKGSLPNSIAEAVDGNLIRLIEDSENMIAYLLLILEVGLECCAELPEERINIKDVVTKLNKIKLQLVRDGHT